MRTLAAAAALLLVSAGVLFCAGEDPVPLPLVTPPPELAEGPGCWGGAIAGVSGRILHPSVDLNEPLPAALIEGLERAGLDRSDFEEVEVTDRYVVLRSHDGFVGRSENGEAFAEVARVQDDVGPEVWVVVEWEAQVPCD